MATTGKRQSLSQKLGRRSVKLRVRVMLGRLRRMGQDNFTIEQASQALDKSENKIRDFLKRHTGSSAWPPK